MPLSIRALATRNQRRRHGDTRANHTADHGAVVAKRLGPELLRHGPGLCGIDVDHSDQLGCRIGRVVFRMKASEYSAPTTATGIGSVMFPTEQSGRKRYAHHPWMRSGAGANERGK